MGQLTPATVADHVERATDEKSFKEGALQSICGPHHAEKRAAESKGTEWRPRFGFDASGNPLGDHHWNR
jgi:hypothetical protein